MVERVHVMLEGDIVESGAIDAMFAQPRHAYTRALLDAVPRLDAAGATP
jgi:ABC-type dipeptide/oligopeptide/nickel transport system ATPase component